MKIGLLAVNAKYIHTNLPLRYLRQRFTDPSQFSFFEYTTNQQVDTAYGELLCAELDVLFVSLYIWNAAWIHQVMSNLKKVRPQLKVLIGGPEAVSLEDYKSFYPWADVLIVGDLDHVTTKAELYALISTTESTYDVGCGEMSVLPFAYTELELIQKALFYYESERGCPFQCTFCMASEQNMGQSKPLELVFKDLKKFMDAGALQVKFVDRTFNAHKKRALDLLAFIIKHAKGETNFHFELAPHLVDADFLALVQSAPEGLFQFELGLQSFHPETLKAIRRHPDQVLSEKNIKSLLECNTAHIHVDLIAGLPHENLLSFASGFNRLMALKPHMIQLGFLKLMKGTALYEERRLYNYKTREYAPFEVLENDSLSGTDLHLLKRIEDTVEKMYNSHRFEHSLDYLLTFFMKDAFVLFRDLSLFRSIALSSGSLSTGGEYEVLHSFAKKLDLDQAVFKNLLLLDYLTHYSAPTAFYQPSNVKLSDSAHETLRLLSVQHYLLESQNSEPMPAKELLKKGQIAEFTIDLDTFVNEGTVIHHSNRYFVIKHKNSKHAVPRYAYLLV